MKGFKLNLDLCVPEIDQFAFVNNIGIINVSNNVLAVNQPVPNATATNTQNRLNSVVNMDARNQAGNTNVIDSSMLNSGVTLLVINNTVSAITDVVSTTTSQGSVSNILRKINNTNQINTTPQAIL
jgi:hypothetical protein